MKKLKKYVLGISLGTVLAANAIIAFASSSNASVSMKPGQTVVKTGTVGVSCNASAEGLVSDTTSGSVTYKIYAAWTGWPYTKEQTHTLGPGSSASWKETQSKNSVYYLQLNSNSDAAALGKIYIQ